MRTADAESAFAEVKRLRRATLVEDVPATVSDAERAVAGLADALGVIGERRAAAERQLAAARDAIERERALIVIDAANARIARAPAGFETASRDLMDALDAVSTTRGHGLALASFAGSFMPELGATLGRLRDHASVLHPAARPCRRSGRPSRSMPAVTMAPPIEMALEPFYALLVFTWFRR